MDTTLPKDKKPLRLLKPLPSLGRTAPTYEQKAAPSLDIEKENYQHTFTIDAEFIKKQEKRRYIILFIAVFMAVFGLPMVFLINELIHDTVNEEMLPIEIGVGIFICFVYCIVYEILYPHRKAVPSTVSIRGGCLYLDEDCYPMEKIRAIHMTSPDLHSTLVYSHKRVSRGRIMRYLTIKTNDGIKTYCFGDVYGEKQQCKEYTDIYRAIKYIFGIKMTHFEIKKPKKKLDFKEIKIIFWVRLILAFILAHFVFFITFVTCDVLWNTFIGNDFVYFLGCNEGPVSIAISAIFLIWQWGTLFYRLYQGKYQKIASPEGKKQSQPSQLSQPEKESHLSPQLQKAIAYAKETEENPRSEEDREIYHHTYTIDTAYIKKKDRGRENILWGCILSLELFVVVRVLMRGDDVIQALGFCGAFVVVMALSLFLFTSLLYPGSHNIPSTVSIRGKCIYIDEDCYPEEEIIYVKMLPPFVVRSVTGRPSQSAGVKRCMTIKTKDRKKSYSFGNAFPKSEECPEYTDIYRDIHFVVGSKMKFY